MFSYLKVESFTAFVPDAYADLLPKCCYSLTTVLSISELVGLLVLLHLNSFKEFKLTDVIAGATCVLLMSYTYLQSSRTRC